MKNEAFENFQSSKFAEGKTILSYNQDIDMIYIIYCGEVGLY